MSVNYENINNEFLKSSILNLNWAGMSAPPKFTLDAAYQWNLKICEVPSLHAWTTFEPQIKAIRQSLAQLIGANACEIAIMRNATEALVNVILGLSLQKDDEIIVSKFDYPNLIAAWQQRAHKDGVKLCWAEFNTPSENITEFVAAYEKLFTPKTRLINLTHIINWNGQIMPIQQIASLARARGIEVLVDGSQSFGLLDYNVTNLSCDYFVTGLHKWLNAPIGTGLLFIRKEKISQVFALMDHRQPQGADILKFERFGISNLSDVLAIQQSIDFHYFIGTNAKRQRLFELKNRWVKALQSHPEIEFFTPFSVEWSCAIATFRITTIDNSELVRILLEKYKIHVVSIEKPPIFGIRVSPSVATSEKDIDYFIDVILEILKEKKQSLDKQ